MKKWKDLYAKWEEAVEILSDAVAACRSSAAARNKVLMLVSEPDEFMVCTVYTEVMEALEENADKFDFICNTPEPPRHGLSRGALPSTDKPRALALLAMADPSGITLERLLTAPASGINERAIGFCAAARPQWKLSRRLSIHDNDPEVFLAAWEAAREAGLAGDTAAVDWLFQLYDDPEVWRDSHEFFKVAEEKIFSKYGVSFYYYEDEGIWYLSSDHETDEYYAYAYSYIEAVEDAINYLRVHHEGSAE